MVFQARGPSLMAALGPGVGICGRPGGLEKKVVLREMDVESGRVLRGRRRDASTCAATAPEPRGVCLWGRRRWSWWWWCNL